MIKSHECEAYAEDERRVHEWRREQFRRLGFSELEAETLAATPDVDLHRVRTLTEQGCARTLVLRIVL